MNVFAIGATQAVVSNLGSAFAGLAATAIVGILVFPIRTFFKNVRDEWRSATQKLAGVEKELNIQRTNCLTTLQQQGDRQVELLEKVSNTLSEMHLDQRESLAYLKAKD
jgi:hypothetical protein